DGGRRLERRADVSVYVQVVGQREGRPEGRTDRVHGPRPRIVGIVSGDEVVVRREIEPVVAQSAEESEARGRSSTDLPEEAEIVNALVLIHAEFAALATAISELLPVIVLAVRFGAEGEAEPER